MQTLIGQDVNGRPLRIGDTTVIISTKPEFNHFKGEIAIVVGFPVHSQTRKGEVAIKVPSVADLSWEELRINGHNLQKVENFEKGDWGDIAIHIGWMPPLTEEQV